MHAVLVPITEYLRPILILKSILISVTVFHYNNLDVVTINCRSQQGAIKKQRFMIEYVLLCKNSQIGDEFHYIFECPTLDVERHMYLKPYYRIRGNTLKMNALMNSENSSEMSNLAKFCRCIMNKFE